MVPQKVRATKSKKRVKLYEQIPKTSYEFVRVWRSIAADEKVKYINKIGSCKSIGKSWRCQGRVCAGVRDGSTFVRGGSTFVRDGSTFVRGYIQG